VAFREGWGSSDLSCGGADGPGALLCVADDSHPTASLQTCVKLVSLMRPVPLTDLNLVNARLRTPKTFYAMPNSSISFRIGGPQTCGVYDSVWGCDELTLVEYDGEWSKELWYDQCDQGRSSSVAMEWLVGTPKQWGNVSQAENEGIQHELTSGT
jgi:hypothetical protein